MLQDGQRPIIAFTVLAKGCGPKAKDQEMGTALFIKTTREGKTIFRGPFKSKRLSICCKPTTSVGGEAGKPFSMTASLANMKMYRSSDKSFPSQ